MKCCTDKKDDLATEETAVKIPCQKDCPNCKKKEEDKEKGSSIVKTISVSAIFLLGSIFVHAEGQPKTFWDDPFNSPMLPVYIVMSFVFITVLLVLVVAVYLAKVIRLFTQQIEKEKAAKLGVVYVASQSWWQKTWDKLNDAVPVSREEDIDLGHDFDGIRELDNHLPPWWKGLFYGSIVWGAIYLFLYHVIPTLPLPKAEYNNELAAAEQQARILRASQPVEAIDEQTLVFSNDQEIIQKGKLVFSGNNCGSCHRPDGGGNAIGPNLTDSYWLHGGDVKNVFSTIKTGVLEKGMPAWGKVMSPADVRNVTFYVMSLQGTNPAGAKAAQGQLFENKTEAPMDSVKQTK